MSERDDGGHEQSDSGKPGSGRGKTYAVRWIILAVVLFAGLWIGIQTLRNAEPGGGEGGGAPQGPAPATVVVEPVVQRPVQERRRVTGTLMAVKRAEVAAKESGAVEDVFVDVGDPVEKGDVLVKLDERRLNASLAEAKARLTAAESVVTQRAAESERAKVDLERKVSLFQQRAVSEREFLDAKREASVTEARKDSAEEERAAAESVVDLLQVRLDDIEVLAPFSGRVIERHVDPGEWLSPGEPVMTVTSAGTIEAWMNVPERFIAEISEAADDLEIVVDGSGMRVPANSIRQVADIDPVTRLFPVVVEVDDQDGLLAPGLSVHAHLPIGKKRELLSVPVDAVIETFQGASVMRVAPGPEGKLPVSERVAVQVVFREGGNVFLRAEGLKPGERVVVEGNERLFPGTPLVVGEPDKTTPPTEVEEVKP